MDLEALRDDVAFLTSTSTNEYSSADRNTNINSWYRNVVSFILSSHEYFDFSEEEAYTNLVANQKEYAFPADLLEIKRVRVKLDGTWRVARPFDPHNTGEPLDSTSVTDDFDNARPYYDVRDTAGTTYIVLYPPSTSNVTDGLYIFYKYLASDMSNDTDEPVFAEPFHRVLAYGASYDWAIKNERFPLADRLKANIEQMKMELKDFYSVRQEHQMKYMQPTPAYYKNYENPHSPRQGVNISK